MVADLHGYLLELLGEAQAGKAARLYSEIRKHREEEERLRKERMEAIHPFVLSSIFICDYFTFDIYSHRDRIKRPSEEEGVRIYRKEDEVEEFPVKKNPKKKKKKYSIFPLFLIIIPHHTLTGVIRTRTRNRKHELYVPLLFCFFPTDMLYVHSTAHVWPQSIDC